MKSVARLRTNDTAFMRRREFITLVGAAASWPLAARAQQAMPVVGFLRSTAAAGSEPLVRAFRQGLNEAGFIEGQNVAVEYRWADDHDDRIPGITAELVRRKSAVIVANGIAAVGVKSTTTAIPIVFATGFDPVRTGLVTSLNRTGGNATGVVFTQTDLAAKQLGLLHELAPKVATIGVFGDAHQPELDLELRDIEAAGRAIGRQILVVKVDSEREFNASFATILRAGAGAPSRRSRGSGPTHSSSAPMPFSTADGSSWPSWRRVIRSRRRSRCATTSKPVA